MTSRLEVLPGAGTVLCHGSVASWAGPAASAALLSWLDQSCRNLAPSPRGGDLLATHVAAVLAGSDPEPAAAFACVGPDGAGGRAVLLHGPVQLWDGTAWHRPPNAPGWVRRTAPEVGVLLVAALGDLPDPSASHPLLHLLGGVVPGGGFVLVPTPPPAGPGPGPAPADGRGDVGPAGPGGTGAGGPAPVSPVQAIDGSSGPGAGLAEPEGLVPGGGSPVPGGGPDDTAGLAGGAGDLGPGGEVLGEGAADGEERSDPSQGATTARPLWDTPPVGGGPDDTIVVGRDPTSVLATPTSDPVSHDAPGGDGTAVLVPSVGGTTPSAAEDDARRGDQRGAPTTGDAPAGVIAVTASEARPRPASRTAPVVRGVRCPNGHFNHPGSTVCARCGRTIEARELVVSGPRPPLGVIVVDDGSIWRLDHTFLLGAAPEADPTVTGGMAQSLPVPGDRVADAHAELRVGDWAVTLVDRGSSGGTWVLPPGGSGWERMEPFHQHLLRPGSHVAVGARVLTYISAWPG